VPRAFALLLTAFLAAASLDLAAQANSSAAPKPAQKPATGKATTQRKPAPKTPAKAEAVPEPPKPKPVPPDFQLTTTHATGDTRTTSAVQLKGARARIMVGDNLASIQQCDRQQTVQLNTQTRTYLERPFDKGTDEAETAALEGRKRGGQVIYSTAVTDTGETQTMFGMTAKHLKIVVTKDSSTSACDKKPQKVETDGWYVDLPSTVSCATVPQQVVHVQVDPQHADCVDEVKYEQAQTPVGYPLKYTTVSTTDDGAPVTTTMEVTQLERVDVPSADVEVPADYVAVHNVAQLTADHRPGEPGAKKAGTLRVGLMPVANRSASQIEVDALNDALLESFSETELDVVRLNGSSQAEIDADAKAKQVDLFLTNTIAEVKVPRGGLVGRINGSAGDAFQAKVDYALVAPGQPKPAHTGSERSGGGSTLATAIAIAKKVAQFAPPLMMARYGYMNAYGSMLAQGGAAPGAMRQTPDPVMNMAFSLLDRAAAPKAAEQFTTEEGAVASALEKVIKSVVSDVAKLSAPAKRGQ
jgi:hypothetical protein